MKKYVFLLKQRVQHDRALRRQVLNGKQKKARLY